MAELTNTTTNNTTHNQMPTSKIDKLYSKHRTILRRLDDIESRISSRVVAHRRRAMNNLEETPTSRRTHCRIFISHRVEGGNDAGSSEDEKKKDESTATSAPTAAAAVPRGGHGGKDFSALLHSSAHQNVPEEEEKPLHQREIKKGVRKWTLVIEGGLLIKHLDHDSVKIVDDKLDKGLPILGCGGSAGEEDMNGTTATATKSESSTKLKDQWKGGNNERENEITIDPINFTHLFDKLEVELKIIKKNDKAEVLETSAITRSGKFALVLFYYVNSCVQYDVSVMCLLHLVLVHFYMIVFATLCTNICYKYLSFVFVNRDNAHLPGHGSVPEPPKPEEIAEVKKIVWERSKSNAPDTNAFFIAHNEDSEFKSMGGKVFTSIFSTDKISAKIKLYRRQGDETNYIPSIQLCEVFFPTFIDEKAAGDTGKRSSDKSKNKKRKRSSAAGGDVSRTNSITNLAEMIMNEASNSSMMGSIPPGKEAAFANRQMPPVTTFPSAADHPDKEVYVPKTITMDEALYAIFFYIRTRELQDAADQSIINNDETLTNLFGCSRMLLSAVRGLLIEKQLVQPCTQPIVFNYDMTVNGAEPLLKTKSKVVEPQKKVELGSTRRKSAIRELESDKSDNDEEDEEPHQTMLSLDVDVEVPNLFHVRTRELLRRTTLRSFEYTSCRIKAIRSLVATDVHEDTAKQVVSDVVSGKGYAPHHKQAIMAISNGAMPGGEVQRAAAIDLRTTALIEKLNEPTAKARQYWDLVAACQNLDNKEEKQIIKEEKSAPSTEPPSVEVNN